MDKSSQKTIVTIGFIFLLIAMPFVRLIAQDTKWQWIRKIDASENNRIGKDIVTDSEGNLYIPTRAAGNINVVPGNTISSNDEENAVVFKVVNGQPQVFVIANDVSDGSDEFSSVMSDVYINANDQLVFGGEYDRILEFRSLGVRINRDIESNGLFALNFAEGGAFKNFSNGQSQGNDELKSVAIDKDGNYFISGILDGENFSFSGDNNQETHVKQEKNIAIAKYSSEGRYLWTAYGFPSGLGVLQSMVLDEDGNVYATGYFAGSFTFGDANGNFTESVTSNQNGEDYFILKINADGSNGWLKSFGNEGRGDQAKNMTIGSDGSIYITGRANNLDNISGYDIFLAKHTKDGDFEWVRRAGSDKNAPAESDDAEPGKDFGNAVVADLQGNVYVTGSFGNPGEFSAPNKNISVESNSSEQRYVYVAKYASNGDLVWATNTDGDFHFAETIALDKVGNIYLAGDYEGSVSLDENLAIENTYSNTYGVFIIKMNQTPAISEVEDNQGAPTLVFEAGDNFVIKGSYFDPVDIEVKLGGLSLTGITVNGEGTEINATIPQDITSGEYNLQVTSHGLLSQQNIQINLNKPPSFQLSTENINLTEDFDEATTVHILPDDNTPIAGYSFNPTLEDIAIADLSYNTSDQAITISSVENAYGLVEITVTATDEGNSNNTFSKTLTLTITAVNDPPTVAQAISDLNVLQDADPVMIDLSEVFLDEEDTELSYTVENSNEDLVLAEENDTQLILTFIAGATGEAAITVIATDSEGATVNDLFTVTVNEAGSNLPPIAVAKEIPELTDNDGDGKETLTLDGSESSDSDGNIVSYIWTRNDEILAETAVSEQTLDVGVHEIVLTVEDDKGETDTDAITVVIKPKPDHDDDTDGPVLSHTVNENQEFSSPLTLLVTATDVSGIDEINSKLRYSGLSQDFSTAREVALEKVDDGYSFTLSTTDINSLNDPLGIRYAFEFRDIHGNPTVQKGYTYWSYGPQHFSAESSEVGPWYSINEKNDLSFTDYNIIAFPFESQSISGVLGGLGEYDDAEWRLFRHIPGIPTENDKGFRELNTSGFSGSSMFEHGNGYFLIMRSSQNISFGGMIAEMSEEVDGTMVHEIVLKDGWNLIGNPYPFAIDWQNVRTANPGSPIGNINRLSRSGYGDTSNELKAFEGAFIFHEGTDMIVQVPVSTRSSANRIAKEKDKDSGWELPIHVEIKGIVNRRNGIGMRADSKDSWDIHDAVQLPQLSAYPEMVMHEESRNLPLNRSIVSEQENFLWQAELRGGKAGEMVRLSWDNSVIQHMDQKLYLWDELNSRMIDMSVQSESSFRIPEEGKLPLQIYFGTQEDLISILDIMQFRVGMPYPNPTSSRFKLPFTMPQGKHFNTHLQLNIFNNLGYKVVNYSFGQLTSGYHVLQVDLPKGMSSGLYHYQLVIEGEKKQVLSGRIVKQ
ncbi:PKD domain-containing protein [Catalinimonas niigatensis]|uniref:PKD domain-containing protein n=1 Tax=Catalinimonas niigatensis TaxID=1397264 RepID=UPI0026651BE6|nr:PKD domain-containing protein [Catalinimonas niigatensis]WPP49138.1 PKD domain-containing protein [Catalinimonas niigatensis]